MFMWGPCTFPWFVLKQNIKRGKWIKYFSEALEWKYWILNGRNSRNTLKKEHKKFVAWYGNILFNTFTSILLTLYYIKLYIGRVGLKIDLWKLYIVHKNALNLWFCFTISHFRGIYVTKPIIFIYMIAHVCFYVNLGGDRKRN